MKRFSVVLMAVLLLVGCGVQEDADQEDQAGSQTTPETASETTSGGGGGDSGSETAAGDSTSAEALTAQESSKAAEGRTPEEVLALQYEYINRGDFEQAYALFAEQSRREISPGQYRAFFGANAPYSVTDYSFSPAQTQGDSATVDSAFTVTSASGVEQLQRTQRFVREGSAGDWRVVARPDQIAAITAAPASEPSAEAEPAPAPPSAKGPSAPKKKQGKEEKKGGSAAITIRVTGTPDIPFSGSYGTIDGQRSVDGVTPQEFEVEVDTGLFAVDSVTAVMQKQAQDQSELRVEMVQEGEVVAEQNTTAQFGVATVNYDP